MSADNWTKCPMCLAAQIKARDAARKAYGKVSAEEYEKLLAKTREDVNDDDTFREDYEIGVTRGKFYVSYCGSCQVCKYRKQFTHEEDLI